MRKYRHHWFPKRGGELPIEYLFEALCVDVDKLLITMLDGRPLRWMCGPNSPFTYTQYLEVLILWKRQYVFVAKVDRLLRIMERCSQLRIFRNELPNINAQLPLSYNNTLFWARPVAPILENNPGHDSHLILAPPHEDDSQPAMSYTVEALVPASFARLEVVTVAFEMFLRPARSLFPRALLFLWHFKVECGYSKRST